MNKKLLKDLFSLYCIYNKMVIYNCQICNFSTDKSTNYSRHLITKKHLRKVKEKENLLSHIEIQALDPKIQVSDPKIQASDPKIQLLDPIFSEKEKMSKMLNEYICEYCDKKFKHRTNYYRHVKHRCKIKLKKHINDLNNNDLIKKDISVQEIIEMKMEEQKLEMNNKMEEQKRIFEEKLLEITENKCNNTTINNGNIADNMINNNQNITIQILNEMKPKDLLNKYYHNTPSLNELMEYLKNEYITASDAKQIKNVEDQEIQDQKIRLNFIAYAVNDIINHSTRRLIESKDLKDAYCNSCLFLNDGSMRKYLEKDISWDNSGDINKIQKLVSEICNQTIRKHKVFGHRPPSKDEEISLAKQILKMNNWSRSKKHLIENVKTDVMENDSKDEDSDCLIKNNIFNNDEKKITLKNINE